MDDTKDSRSSRSVCSIELSSNSPSLRDDIAKLTIITFSDSKFCQSSSNQLSSLAASLDLKILIPKDEIDPHEPSLSFHYLFKAKIIENFTSNYFNFIRFVGVVLHWHRSR